MSRLKNLSSNTDAERPSARLALPVAVIEHAFGKPLIERLKTGQLPATAILLQVPSDGWCEVLESCLARGQDKVEVQSFKAGRRGSGGTSNTALLSELGSGTSTIAITATPESVPVDYRALVDQFIEINQLDVVVVRTVIRKLTGQTPRGLQQSDLIGVGIHECVAAIGASASASDCVSRLQRIRQRKSAPVDLAHVPLLNALPLIAPVRQWTDMLLADLKRLDAGTIAPSAIRFATLEGPPGTGKTHLVASIAKSSGWRLHKTSVQDWFNAGDGHLGAVTKACAAFIDNLLAEDRSIGFIDELQSIPDRSRLEARGRDWWMPVVDGILMQIDRVRHAQKKVLLIGACNHYDLLDPALIRPGRLETRITVAPPSTDKEARDLVRFYVGGRLKPAEIESVANLTIGKTPAEIEALVRKAEALSRAGDRELSLADLTNALVPDDGLDAGQRYALALHESAHVVIALRLGLKVRSVTIIPTGTAAGLTELEATSLAPSLVEIENRVAAQLAGRAADELLGNGADAGASGDLAISTLLLIDARQNWGLFDQLSSRDGAAKLAPAFDGSEMEKWLETQLWRLMDRARRLVTENEHAIRLLATELVAKRVLQAPAIEKVLARADELPKPCEPPIEVQDKDPSKPL